MLSKKDKLLATAQKYLERGQNERALEELARVVQDDPNDTRTWLRMAEIHARTGALPQARDIYLRTAEIYVEQGFLNKAVTVYKSVLKLTPGVPQVRERLGEIYRRLGMVAEALRELELAVVERKRNGQVAAALPALRKIVGLHPDNVVSRVKLAEAASEAGAVDEAIHELRQAADQLKSQGRGDEYVRVAERLFFHCPNDYAVARELAAVYIHRRNPRLALSKLQAALKAAPRDPQNVSLLAEALAQLDPPKAISVWRELAEIHHEAGRPGERDNAVRAALNLDPTDGETREMAAVWGIVFGTVGRARPTPPLNNPITGVRPAPPPLRSGVHRLAMPGSAEAGGSGITPPPTDDIGRILAEADVFVKYGLSERAVEHLRRVFALEPEHRGARERLSTVLAGLGRKAEAANELATLAGQLKRVNPADAALVAERALTLDPSCAAASDLLGRTPGPEPESAAAESEELAAELEQVDFFMQQSLFDEAGTVLDDLEARFPGERLLTDKRRALDRASGNEGQGAIPIHPGDEREVDAARAPVVMAGASDLDDPATHGDLGIAYKQMGLYDAAIAEFRQLADDRNRRVFALTMIGECVEAKGDLGEAVAKYKEALNLPQVTATESLELYYLLGAVFERLGDIREALYFFENVGKRDPTFRDVAERIAALKPAIARRA